MLTNHITQQIDANDPRDRTKGIKSMYGSPPRRTKSTDHKPNRDETDYGVLNYQKRVNQSHTGKEENLGGGSRSGSGPDIIAPI